MSDEVSLRDHIEAVLNEQRRGMIVAEQEREKAAAALRGELARAIEEGDHNLREHIDQQVVQIREALISAEKLDLQRHKTTDQRIDNVRENLVLMNQSSAEAIKKAEAATERRFESVNEFRQSLSDQTSQFIRREVFDAKVEQLQGQIQQLRETNQRTEGKGAGVNATFAAIAVVATLLISALIVVIGL